MRRSDRGPKKRNSQNPNNNNREPIRQKGFISPETKSFAYGVGVGVLATIMFPQIKDNLKPVAAVAAKGAVGIADKFQEMISGMREGIEDIVAEAKWENLKKTLDNEILKDPAVETVKHMAEKVAEGVAEDVVKDVIEDAIL